MDRKDASRGTDLRMKKPETRGERNAGDSAFDTCRLHRAMSAFKGDPKDICSRRVLLSPALVAIADKVIE
jgi:hypothetical protein